MTLEIWGIASDRLLKTLGRNNHKSWIEPLELVETQSDTAHFSVPTSFFGNSNAAGFDPSLSQRTTGRTITTRSRSPGGFSSCPDTVGKQAAKMASSVRTMPMTFIIFLRIQTSCFGWCCIARLVLYCY